MTQPNLTEMVASIIREHHRTHVRQSFRTNEPRRTFHQGDKDAAAAILAAISVSREAIRAEVADEIVARLRKRLKNMPRHSVPAYRNGRLVECREIISLIENDRREHLRAGLAASGEG